MPQSRRIPNLAAKTSLDISKQSLSFHLQSLPPDCHNLLPSKASISLLYHHHRHHVLSLFNHFLSQKQFSYTTLLLVQLAFSLILLPKMASQHETNNMDNTATDTIDGTSTETAMVSLKAKYSNRVLVKTIVERDDGGVGLIGERLVIGGWVKSSKEVKKEPVTPAPTSDNHGAAMASSPKRKEKNVKCAEILQSKIPFLRTIIRVLSGSAGGGASTDTIREKLEAVLPKPPPPSTLFLQISDGSSVAALQMVVDSGLASPSRLLPTGTCILAEGVLNHSSFQGKHAVELTVEKILHIGTVDQDKYILSRKRLPLDKLRDSAHFRPRSTTAASVMRIRSSLTFATHTFFQNNGFLCVQVPIITTTDAEGFSEKFQVTTLLEKADKEGPNAAKEIEGVSLDNIKTAIKEKSHQVEQLKRSESNKEALVAALQDLKKTNELASKLEAREKTKPAPSIKTGKINISEDFFSRQIYLTVSGRLHLESYACALGNVYSFGPRFRAEKKESAKQGAEMWMVEAEIAFSLLEDAMNCADDYFKFLCTWVVEKCERDAEFISTQIDKTIIDRLQSMKSCFIEKITYTEAVKALEQVTDKIFEAKLEWGVALTAEHLSYLADEIYKSPLIIHNYPKAVKPFYVRLNDDGNTVAAFDMVVPKIGKLITGSQNEERINKLNKRIEELGLPKEQYEWYLDLRRHGTVKHSGFSLGFDLMVLFITGLTDVKDAIPFPRSLGIANN